MAKSSKLKVALVKIESTYGTDAAPTAANDAVLLRSIDVSPLETQEVERTYIRPSFGAYQRIVAGSWMKATIELEVAGFGTAGPTTPTPGYDALLQAAGLARTVTAGTSVVYNPASSNLVGVTFYYYLDGLLYKMIGARAESVDIVFNRNQIPVYKITLLGLYGGIADTAIITPTLTAYQVPLTVSKFNTTLANFFGTATGICLEALTVNIKNVTSYRNLVNCTEAITLQDRQITGSVTIELPSVGSKDIWSQIRSSGTSAIAMTHGTTSGNKVTVSIPNADPTNPKQSSQDTIEMLSVDFSCVPSVANDELLLTVA